VDGATAAAAEFEIVLNGEPYRLSGPTTLASLLERLGVHPQAVAVELNYDIVRRDRLASTPLGAGDKVEVVRMIGGG
jgi:sulfur carrier protein